MLRKLLTLCVAFAVLGGCASNERAARIEERVAALEAQAKTGGGDQSALDERLAAMERREEFLRLEVARLERWQKALRKREAERGEAKPAEPAKPAAPQALTYKAAPQYASDSGGLWKDPFKFSAAIELGKLYALGKNPGADGILQNDELGAPGGPKPMKPRDPGEKGIDGDTLLGKPLQRTRFLGSGGETVDVKDFVGQKNVVLVVLRGFDGGVPCVACSGQTLAISQNLDQFEQRDAEVFLIYPGKADSVTKFLDNVRELQGGGEPLPVQMLLDVDLAVVKEFKIEGRLAKPTTVIVDRKGVVRFAHVGQSKTDRPTVPQMLAALDRIRGAK